MRKFITNTLLILLICAPIVAIWQRQSIYDWWALRSYTPSTEVVALADTTTMTDKARRIFYIAKPVVKTDKSGFRQECDSAEKTIVLGCFKSSQGIYVYNVDDDRLAGIEEVTAAHEMLHAAYDRLSNDERQKIDSLTELEYNKITNERIRKNVESYRSRDTSVVPNELHSILGTEVSELSPELETYYAKYFINRAKVVALSEQYEAEFSKRENQVSVYDDQLKSLKASIDSLNETLEKQDQQISSQRKTMDQLRAADNTSQYNAMVAPYNALVKSYNANIATLKQKIDQYNAIVNQRNAIVTEEQQLLQAIDTRIPDTK